MTGMGDASLVEMTVLRVSPYLREDRPLLWLGEKDVDSPRLLAIAIGEFEAAAIQMPLEGEDPVRPISYDLLSSMLGHLNVAIGHVVIDKVQESVFYARVVVEHRDRAQSLDSRPSDAVALALRTGAPIYVSRSLLEEVGMAPEDDGEDTERSMERFHEFEPQIIEAPPAARSRVPDAPGDSAGQAHKQQPRDELSQLHTRLQRAVICEDYEEAARLRDEIESKGNRPPE